MRIQCPHCQHPVEVVLDHFGLPDTTLTPEQLLAADSPKPQSVEVVTCPLCGSSISLHDPDRTTSFRDRELQKIGRFGLIEHLGSGHFGDVWLAQDSTLDRKVALKVPRRGELEPGDIELFLRKARAAAQLHHPNIVHLHEVSLLDDLIYIVSEVIHGPNLQDWLTAHSLTPAESAQLCATLADALHHAHEAGVVHRDMKPANVLMDEHAQPHITDFGLAKRDGAEITMTVEGRILGTPAYMPPEQARGDAHNADRRSDVYSLGVILYELLTGKRPFEGKSKMVMIQQVLHEEPRVPRAIKKTIPRDLQTICLKALEKAPERRYQTAKELADDLRRFLEGKPILARPVSPLEKTWRWIRRNRLAAASAAVIVVLAGSLIGMYSSNQPLRHRVQITTNPPRAKMYFFPLDTDDGHPQPEKRVYGGRSPVNVRLEPGEYLVVAVMDDGRFHEVFRRVPLNPSELPVDVYPHTGWESPSPGVVQLEEIEIPPLSVADGMARFEGSEDFEIGSDNIPGSPPHRRRIQQFLIDTTEVTFGAFSRKRKGKLPATIATANLKESDALRLITYDQAIAYAESIGKRLPDEAEYEFAATNAGTTVFPWGNDPAAITKWQFGQVGIEPVDRTPTDPPVLGLYSNVAEWTTSFGFYPTPGPRYRFPDLASLRIVRGGPKSVVDGTPKFEEWKLGVRDRNGEHRKGQRPGLGLRCARSAKPRLEPADFSGMLESR